MAMSMRSRAAAAAARRSRSGLRSVYEDFKPKSEWKHKNDHSDDEYILHYHLPGFVKEQIRIIAESKEILRVRGERLLTDNKWSRFEEEVTVPEDCNISGIRAKFEDGILKIIMPKIYGKIENKSPITKKETTNSAPQPLPSKVKQSPIQQQAQQLKDGLASSSKPPSYIEQAPKTSIDSQQPLIPSLGKSEPQPKKLYDTTNIESESEEVGHDNKGILGKNNDTNKEKRHNVIASVDDQVKNYVNKSNENHGVSNMKNLTKVTRRLDEDRQLVVNMGVAILVIMALGASITYSLGFSDQFNN